MENRVARCQFTKRNVSKQARTFLTIGAILGAISVAVGAFGAHGLNDFLEETGRIDTFKTAVNYLWYHTFAVLLVGLISMHKPSKLIHLAGYLFLLGILLFSGSLFLLIKTSNPSLGAVTPFGGLMFIVGWVLLAVGIFKR